jgi:hypothetical protein
LSATILLEQALARVRSSFTRKEVATVQAYGGEFSAAEIPYQSYSCPAIFLTVLGWEPANGRSKVLTGRNTKIVRLAGFVAYKAAKREERMAGAMLLAERLDVCLRQWTPMQDPGNESLPVTIAGLEDDPTTENLYSRAVDKIGQALFLVDWRQCVKPNVPLAQMWDLLHVEIVDRTRAGVVPADPPPAPPPFSVTEDVQFPSN